MTQGGSDLVNRAVVQNDISLVVKDFAPTPAVLFRGLFGHCIPPLTKCVQGAFAA